MKNVGSITLETSRLVLRKQRLDDAEMMYNNWASDENVTKFLTMKSFNSIEETRNALRKIVLRSNNLDYYCWAIVLKESNEVIGFIRVISIDPEEDSIEIGYGVGSKFWEHGYTTEAFNRVLKFLFEEVEAKSVWASHDVDNTKTSLVLRKCGLVYFRDSYGQTTFHADGFHRDYIITKEEYLKLHN